MTKYAMILASILVVTGCKSARNPEYGQTDDNSSYSSSAPAASSAYSGSQSSQTAPAHMGVTAPAAGVGQPGVATTTEQSGINPSENGQANDNISAANGQAGINTSGQVSGNQSATERTDQFPNTAGQSSQSTPSAEGQPTTVGSNASANNQSQQGLGTMGQSGTATGTETQSSPGLGANDQMLIQSVTNSLSSAGIPSQTLQNVHVRAMKGRVILTGRVNSQTEKQQIEQKAMQTPGVQSVNDLLRVQPNGGAYNPAVEQSNGQNGVNRVPEPGADSSAPTVAPGQTPSPVK